MFTNDLLIYALTGTAGVLIVFLIGRVLNRSLEEGGDQQKKVQTELAHIRKDLQMRFDTQAAELKHAKTSLNKEAELRAQGEKEVVRLQEIIKLQEEELTTLKAESQAQGAHDDIGKQKEEEITVLQEKLHEAGENFKKSVERSQQETNAKKELQIKIDQLTEQAAEKASLPAGRETTPQSATPPAAAGDVDDTIAVIAANIQDPVRKMASFAQMLARHCKGKLEPNAEGFIANIVEGSIKIQRMLGDLIGYSQFARQKLNLTAASCAQAFEQAKTNLKTAIDESGATITSDQLPTIKGDNVQLVILFQNLLANAIIFRGKDQPPKIHVAIDSNDREWIFSLQDNGIGFDPQLKNLLFLPFKKLHPDGHYPGCGIGLALTKRIVEAHQGRIWAQSAGPGSGATFYFTIPKVTQTTEEQS